MSSKRMRAAAGAITDMLDRLAHVLEAVSQRVSSVSPSSDAPSHRQHFGANPRRTAFPCPRGSRTRGRHSVAAKRVGRRRCRAGGRCRDSRDFIRRRRLSRTRARARYRRKSRALRVARQARSFARRRGTKQRKRHDPEPRSALFGRAQRGRASGPSREHRGARAAIVRWFRTDDGPLGAWPIGWRTRGRTLAK
jgi:hypothetical protein